MALKAARQIGTKINNLSRRGGREVEGWAELNRRRASDSSRDAAVNEVDPEFIWGHLPF